MDYLVEGPIATLSVDDVGEALQFLSEHMAWIEGSDRYEKIQRVMDALFAMINDTNVILDETYFETLKVEKKRELSEREIIDQLDTWRRQGFSSFFDNKDCPYRRKTLARYMFTLGWLAADGRENLVKAETSRVRIPIRNAAAQ